MLSSLGIAVSIAALTAILGLSASNQADVLADLDAQGANLVVVTPVVGVDGDAAELPSSAPAMVARMPAVESVAVLRSVPREMHAYRNDLVPAGESNGLTVAAVDPGYFAAVGAEFGAGESFGEAGRALPEVVLGHEAARLLGVDLLGVDPLGVDPLGVDHAAQRIWVGSEWYAVSGILDPRPRVAGLDTSVLLGDAWAEQRLWSDHDASHIISLTMRVRAESLDTVRRMLAPTVDPSNPRTVSVSNPSALVATRAIVDDSMSVLVAGLAAVALLVGAIGIANTMVVAVLERRGEIGLRRALGARANHIARQFLLECIVLSGVGGIVGWAAGAVVVGVATTVNGQVFVLPLASAALFPGVAVIVGVLAGLQPATRAARVPPTTALKAG
ncbi:ABC transporter permease [Subtercola boreus]|uniref:ABC transporter permease n=1 Tax=Subtercola boreus TaxID=120213 RepID=UPI0015587655|nr:ABC transporter permease [Subtercola boreus]